MIVSCLVLRPFLLVGLALSSIPLAAELPPVSAVSQSANSEWVPLFNGKNLDGWISRRGSRGDATSQSVEDMFQVHDGVIHVYRAAAPESPQFNGNLRTTESFSSFHLQLEYRWMDARFSPRQDAVRDAGILFHLHTDPDKVWPPSVEMQLGGGEPGAPYVSGDLWVISNTRALSPSIAGTYQPDAPPVLFGLGKDVPRVNRTSIAATKPHGEWNLAELIVHASTGAEFYLNGILVGTVSDLQFQDAEGQWQPLSSGPISIQAEWAELQYRNIRIKKL
jgi:hypothetical protein